MTKKLIYVSILRESFPSSVKMRSFNSFQRWMRRLQYRYKDKFANLSVSFETSEYYYSHNSFDIVLYGARYETDEEYAYRLKIEEKVQKAREKAASTRKINAEKAKKKKEIEEYKLFLKLQNKFKSTTPTPITGT
jgi:hypothetical protein